ncbi:MAG: glycosyltransferase family 2 protein [Patescibacteria group bacterium]
MSQPRIGILYLTFPMAKWERDIPNAMKSLQAMTYPKDRVELICIESKGGREPVWPWFEKEWMPESGKSLPRITYLNRSDEQLGFAENNNLALAKAKELGCDYVYLLNEDAEVAPGFLEPMVAKMEADKTIGIAQSLIMLGEERGLVNSVGNAYHFLGFGYSRGYKWTKEQAETFYAKERETNPGLEIAYASGAGMMVRVADLEGRKLFDEAFFMYHEDTDASFMMRIRGKKVVAVPESVIYHWYEFSKSITKFFWMERNRYAMLFMYLRPWTIALIAPLLIAMELALFVFSLLRGWSEEKIKVYKELVSKNYWHWIGKRRREIQALRKVNDRGLTRLFVAEILFQVDSMKSPALEYVGNPVMSIYWWLIKKLIV